MRRWAALHLVSALVMALPACVELSKESHPLPIDPFPVSQTRVGEVAAHQWTCTGEFWAIDGRFTARVTPSVLHLELGVGSCDAPEDVLVTSSTGTLTSDLTLSHAEYHVRIGNPTDSAVAYSLEVEYFMPSI